MVVDGVLARFRSLRLWRSNGRRAPHKPLLALWAIGRCLSGQERMAPFDVVDRELGDLLRTFGPPRKAIHTEFPFWRMCADGVWEVDNPEIVTTTRSGDAHKSSLLSGNVRGGLLADDYRTFRERPDVTWQVADMLIAAHFPDTYRDDILRATGCVERTGDSRRLDETALEIRDGGIEYELSRRLKRRPTFRRAVLSAYGDQCAVCGLNIRLAGVPIAVEAAHIHWLMDAGPSNVCNGLALCVLHHRLFDRGAFTVAPNYRVVVATQVEGAGFRHALKRFDRQRLLVLPIRDELKPDQRYLRWHAREVFKAPDVVRRLAAAAT